MSRSHKYIHKIVQNGKTRYFYTKQELDAYKKALSSKDEETKYLQLMYGKDSNINKNRDKKIKEANKTMRQMHKTLYKDGWKDYIKLTDPQTYKGYRYARKVKKDYERAKTVKGKANDVKKVFDAYHPDTARKISKGKKKIDKLIKKNNKNKTTKNNTTKDKVVKDKIVKDEVVKDKVVKNKVKKNKVEKNW